MTNNSLKKLRLFHLTSANLPIGNFTYSQGLEWAVQSKWVHDEKTFRFWQLKQINNTLMYVDLPILKRLYLSCTDSDINAFKYWVYFLLANKETSELRNEEMHRGLSFFYLIRDGWNMLSKCDYEWKMIIKKSYLGCLSWIGVLWKISLYDLALSFSYSWIENAVIIGLKLVPFGQKTAHNILKDFCKPLSKLLKYSFSLKDNDLGSSLPLVSIASSRHETQYSRLFRS